MIFVDATFMTKCTVDIGVFCVRAGDVRPPTDGEPVPGDRPRPLRQPHSIPRRRPSECGRWRWAREGHLTLSLYILLRIKNFNIFLLFILVFLSSLGAQYVCDYFSLIVSASVYCDTKILLFRGLTRIAQILTFYSWLYMYWYRYRLHITVF